MKEKFVTLRINGMDTDYVISSKGRIFTKSGDRQKSTEVSKNGYEKVSIQIDKKPKLISVHRAMYESFVGDIPSGYVINHKDGNKLNNSIKNLEAVTVEEKSHYAWRIGLTKPPKDRDGSKNPNCFHTEKDAIGVYTMLKNTSMSHFEIAEALNVDLRFVKNVAMGLWGNITGYNREEIARNKQYSKTEEIVLWYLYSKEGLRNKDLSIILNIDKMSVMNKLTYIKRTKRNEMDCLIEEPDSKRIINNFMIRWSILGNGCGISPINKKY